MALLHNARRVVRLVRRVRSKVAKRFSITKDYYFNLDSPQSLHLEKRTVEVEGWLVSKDKHDVKIRVRNGSSYYEPETGLERFDIMKSFGEKYGDRALNSGFRCEFEYTDGEVVVEVDAGKGFKKLISRPIYFGVDRNPKYFYNKNLAWHEAEHQNLMESRKAYYYEDSIEPEMKLSKDDPRLMAIYLPQFHPFKENDKAWGKGFTEWTNVTSAKPRFIGHEQPLLPSALGFYDLRLESKIKEQIDLAKQFGIHGFAMYYYWFSGKKLMEGPIEAIYNHKEWDFTYSVCWANENWTKRWDGRENDVIVAQEYLEDDPIHFIKDVEKYLLDPRYLRYEGKPILTVYRPSHLKEPERYAKVWREYFKEQHGLELYLISVLSFDDKDPREFGFDAAMDFAPLSAFFKNKHFPDGHFPFMDVRSKLLDINFDGVVADYRSIALNKNLIDCYDFKTFPCVTPSWDNDSRKKGKGFVYTNSNPRLYARWLDNILDTYTKKEPSPIVYINAWNEWAEGAMVEPSQHLGYAVLNNTARVLARYTKNNQKLDQITPHGKLAVVVHLFYDEMWEDIVRRLQFIKEPFDVFVTLPARHSDIDLQIGIKGTQVFKRIVPNRGRDVLPFISVLREVADSGYEKLLKIHTKKSQHRTDGDAWFDELLGGLMPDVAAVQNITKTLSKADTSLVGPSNHIVSLKRHMGSNEPILRHLLERSFGVERAKQLLSQRSVLPYIGGTMFWARVDALKPLLDLELMPDDFQSEHKQIDGTLAHAIERYIGVIAQQDGRQFYTVAKTGGTECINGRSYDAKYTYAP